MKEAQHFVNYNSSTDDESTRGKGFRLKKSKRSFSPIEEINNVSKKSKGSVTLVLFFSYIYVNDSISVGTLPLPPGLSPRQDLDVVSYSNDIIKLFCPDENKVLLQSTTLPENNSRTGKDNSDFEILDLDESIVAEDTLTADNDYNTNMSYEVLKNTNIAQELTNQDKSGKCITVLL